MKIRCNVRGAVAVTGSLIVLLGLVVSPAPGSIGEGVGPVFHLNTTVPTTPRVEIVNVLIRDQGDDGANKLTPGDEAELRLVVRVADCATPGDFKLRVNGQGSGDYAFGLSLNGTFQPPDIPFGGKAPDIYELPGWQHAKLEFQHEFSSELPVPQEAKLRVTFLPGGNEQIISVPVAHLRFPLLSQRPPNIVGDLQAVDCLRKEGPVVGEFAQWAVAHYDHPQYQSDTRVGALLRVEEAIYMEFHDSYIFETTGPRHDDASLLATALRGTAIGNCVDFSDLGSGVLRSLGLQTRDVVGSRFSFTGQDIAHAWLEVQIATGVDPDASALWMPCDPTIMAQGTRANVAKVFDPAGLQPRDATFVRAGDRNLPNAFRFMYGPQFGDYCKEACFIDPVHCTTCVWYWRTAGSSWPADCQQDILDWYQGMDKTRSGGRRNEPAVQVQVEAPTNVEEGISFSATVTLRNVSGGGLDSIVVVPQLRVDPGTAGSCYQATPPNVWLAHVDAGAEAVSEWNVTAIKGDLTEVLTFAVFDRHGVLIGAGGAMHRINASGSLPDVLCELILPNGIVRPGNAVTIASRVADEALQYVGSAVTTATVSDSAGGLIWGGPLTWSPAESLYVAEAVMPEGAKAGMSRVRVAAELAGHDEGTAEGVLEVTPEVLVHLSSLPSSVTPTDTLRCVVDVSDRGSGVPSASVTIGAADPNPGWSRAAASDGTGHYESRTTLYELAAIAGVRTIASGTWKLKATVGVGSSVGSDSTEVVVGVPDLVIENVAADSVLGAVELRCTVRNDGHANSEFTDVRFFSSEPDSSGGWQIGEPVLLFPLAPSWEYDVGVMWQGGTVPDQVVAVVNWGSALLEERIDNNEGVWHSPTSSVGETPPATESTVRLRLEVFPNPFHSETTLRYSVPKRDAVELSIFDVAGRQVRILRTGETEAGTVEATWDGRDVAGRRVSAGVYLARLRTGNGERSDRLIMLH